MLKLSSKYRCSWQVQPLKLAHNFQGVFLYSTSKDEATQSFSNYLVNSLGFSHQQAGLTCTKLPFDKVNDFKFYNNAISVVDFLKRHGFDDTHVRKAVSLFPRILSCKVDETLKPKLELLQEEGFSGSDLVRVISANPTLFVRRMSHVISNLRDVMGSVENARKVFSKSNMFTTSGGLENMISNVALLKNDYGIDINVIRKSILVQYRPFVRNPEFFQNAVVRVEEELGIPRDSKMFFCGIHLLCHLSKKSIESKCQVFKSFGWTEDQVSELMRRSPFTFNCSTENMRKKLGFLMNELGYDPGFLISCYVLLTLSREKRMLPRHRVFLVLKEKGLLDRSFYSAAVMTEANFLKTFVEPFKDVEPGLHELYENSKGCPDIEPLSPVMPSLVAPE